MKIYKYLLITIAPLFLQCSSTGEPSEKPNIILILADDMGYSDLGCTGAEIPTPNLDRLAANGMMMPNFYNAARCCPTRASLITGLYPHQAGMGDMVEGRLWNDSTFIESYQGWLKEDAITLAEALQEEGYHNLFSGKWHIGNEEPNWPDNRGFDRTFAMLHGASNFFNMEPWINENQFMRLHLDGEIYEPGDDFYMTNAITNHALDFIQHSDEHKPFFLYIAYTAPHWPLHALPEDIEKFRGQYMQGWHQIRNNRFAKMKKSGLLPADAKISPEHFSNPATTPLWDTLSQQDKKTWDLRMAVYAAQMYRMDQGIGQLIDYLEKNGKLNNTIIMFLSDNGATKAGIYQATNWVANRSGPIGSENSFDSYGARWANMSNVPYRLFKHWTAEGGIKTPFIMHWPDKIKPNTVIKNYGHIIDIMPTCLIASGASTEKIAHYKLEGSDLLEPQFKNDTSRAVFWEHQGNWAVRKGSWKLLYVNYKNKPLNASLYNLSSDPTELQDIKDDYPDKARELQELYKQWSEYVGVAPFDSLILARPI